MCLSFIRISVKTFVEDDAQPPIVLQVAIDTKDAGNDNDDEKKILVKYKGQWFGTGISSEETMLDIVSHDILNRLIDESSRKSLEDEELSVELVVLGRALLRCTIDPDANDLADALSQYTFFFKNLSHKQSDDEHKKDDD